MTIYGDIVLITRTGGYTWGKLSRNFTGRICLYELPCFSESGTYNAPYFSITLDAPVKSLTKSNFRKEPPSLF